MGLATQPRFGLALARRRPGGLVGAPAIDLATRPDVGCEARSQHVRGRAQTLGPADQPALDLRPGGAGQ
eukprot:15450174-Alexandrium_andersonii.AAC.1